MSRFFTFSVFTLSARIALGSLLALSVQTCAHSIELAGWWQGVEAQKPDRSFMIYLNGDRQGVSFINKRNGDYLAMAMAYRWNASLNAISKPQTLEMGTAGQILGRGMLQVLSPDQVRWTREENPDNKTETGRAAILLFDRRPAPSLTQLLADPELEGRNGIFVLMQAQQRHAIMTGKFALTLKELGFGTAETPNYRYRLDMRGDQQVRLIAQPKTDQLKSYSSGVFIQFFDPKTPMILGGICMSVERSRWAPAMPMLPTQSAAKNQPLQCPSGALKV